ncbi:MAG: hypothetical protein GWN01_16665 [Nitrosopumilaceae archaeon]|nr:hypothetical protein [Nitrosopumilaceae archaeon]NIU88927.1 hypothetical protein [Nitrosopumilaceae archaeon]NIX63067.1 hypothetical protein [Nitrosopumilaceae archaeon]
MNLLDEFELELKKSNLISHVNRIGDQFEVFFEEQNIPCVLGVNTLENVEFANFESFLQFKAGSDPNHHFAMQILRAKTLSNLVKQIEEQYTEKFAKGIDDVKKGFQKDTGIRAEDVETSED